LSESFIVWLVAGFWPWRTGFKRRLRQRAE